MTAIPVIVNFDIDGINTLNDIAIVSGGDIVTSNKGNLISSIAYDSVPIVSSVTVYPVKVMLQHSKTSRATIAHVNYLKNKRSENNIVEDIGKVYDKRIRSLTPNQVLIRLPDDKDFVKISQAIDLGLRTIKSVVDYGVIKKDGRKIPAVLDFAAQKYSSKCAHELSRLGALVT